MGQPLASCFEAEESDPADIKDVNGRDKPGHDDIY
jgi:hypothetical protein